jgi:hypothetical protein
VTELKLSKIKLVFSMSFLNNGKNVKDHGFILVIFSKLLRLRKFYRMKAKSLNKFIKAFQL